MPKNERGRTLSDVWLTAPFRSVWNLSRSGYVRAPLQARL